MTSKEQPRIEMRPFAAADFPAVRALYRKVWHGEARDERYDRMRFVETMDGVCPGVVAMDGETCAGFYMIWPMTLCVGATLVPAGQSIDTMTSLDYQGQGIFTRLARATYELAAQRGIQVLIGAPNAASYPGFMRRLSWAHPCEIITYVRPLSLSGAVPFGAALTPAARLLPLAGEAGVETREEAPAGEALAAFLAAIPAERGIWRVRRTAQWYAFRYQPAGKFDYRWVSVYRDGALAGLAIWGMPLAPDGRLVRANLVELVGLDAAARRAAAAGAVRAARAAGAHVIAAATTSKPLAAPLRSNGFLRYRSGPLIARTLGPQSFDANPFGAGSWGLFGADFDFV